MLVSRVYVERDHDGRSPHMLFVFESPNSESVFPDVVDNVNGMPIITTSVEDLAEHGVMGDAWTFTATLPRQTPVIPDASTCRMTAFPQQLPKVQFVAEPPGSPTTHPILVLFDALKGGDVSTITLSPSQGASASLAAT